MLGCSIHQIEETPLFVKVGRIKDQVTNHRIVEVLGRRILFKPVVLDMLKLALAIPGELTETSNGITLGNPEFKPMLLSDSPVVWDFPGIRVMTQQAAESLLA